MAMQIDLGPEAERFRDELREWLDANRPEGPDDDDERIVGRTLMAAVTDDGMTKEEAS